MKPGASARPWASIASRACQFRRSPITAILPAVTPRSPVTGGVPAPSKISARWIRRSQVLGSVTLRSLVRHQNHEDLLHVVLVAPAERRAFGDEDGLACLERLAASPAVVQFYLAVQEVHELIASERCGFAVVRRGGPQADG